MNRSEHSAVPLVVAISGAILMSAGLGWLILSSDAPSDPALQESSVVTAPPPAAVVEPAPAAAAVIDIATELRKARFAAAADMLVGPPDQNALFFYSRILRADADHAEANAELDAVLSRVALIVSDRLAADDFAGAYQLASLVAVHDPDHELVGVARQAIAGRANRLAADARDLALAGDDDGAAALLAEAAALPGLDAQTVAGLESSVSEARGARVETLNALAEQQRLAETEELAQWSDKIRGAIRAGRLVSPRGSSARDFLAERDGPRALVDQMTDEFLAAVVTESQYSIEFGDVEAAEGLLAAAEGIRSDAAGLDEARQALERRIIELEGAKVLALSDFARVSTEPARYPRGASIRNVSGWVDVEFTVTQTGNTANIVVTAAEPAGEFEEAAVEAVENWRFEPRVFRGRPINQRAATRLSFRLE